MAGKGSGPAPQYRIRIAVPADAGALAGLSGELGYEDATASLAVRLDEILASSRDCVLVAERSGSPVVGWVHVFRVMLLESAPYAEIGGLVVTKSERGRGVGRALVGAAEDWARAAGFTELRVRSNVVREGAHDFYRRLGFRETKTQHVYARSLAVVRSH